MLALGAEFEVTSARGKRIIKAEDFFTDTFTTALNTGEILTKIKIEDNKSSGRYLKYTKYAGDFSILGMVLIILSIFGRVTYSFPFHIYQAIIQIPLYKLWHKCKVIG